jgi:hypothetical protein
MKNVGEKLRPQNGLFWPFLGAMQAKRASRPKVEHCRTPETGVGQVTGVVKDKTGGTPVDSDTPETVLKL